MPDAFERFHDALLAVRRGHSLAVGERQFDVFVDRQIADQVETLKDESDFLVADARALGEIEVLDRLSVQRVAARGRRIEQADDRKQRRLAAARRARHGHVLSFGNRKVNARERVSFDLVGVEDLRHLLNLDQRLPCFGHSFCLACS